jgi:hypothetical protein
LFCIAARTACAAEIDYAVMVSATPQKAPPQITLSWPAHSTTTEYRISRKLTTEATFTPLATITTGTATFTSYVDTSVAVGTGYEYEVRRSLSGDTVNHGYGYIASAIDLPMVETRGKLILLVDETMAVPLTPELVRLEADLRGDGWSVIRHDVSRTASVTSVKSIITTAYNADPANVKSVFLFGRIPVPYSGNIAPDGHVPDHRGAWPADCYYGDINGSWSDFSINTTSATKYGTRNHNVPGDGKFDPSNMPGSVSTRMELMVGRVDLSSLPAFSGLNETQLLKRYLDKDHAWRNGRLTVNRRGLADENSTNVTEKFAAGGYRMLGALFGAANTSNQDFTITLGSNAYLASFGVGGGDTSSCSGVVSTSDFAANDYRTVFTFIFGSYFADWDSTNNLLRAAIASGTHTLVSTWGSRPYPVYHTLGMGDTIGAGIRMTQNFSGNGSSEIYKMSHANNYGQVHVALMGDPTLRLHPVKPVTNLQVTTAPDQNTLTWTASADSDIIGYHVYKASSPTGPLTRLTGLPATALDPAGSPITELSYTDTTATEGVFYYMVKAVKLETSNTGTYSNLSQGVFATNAPAVVAADQSPTGVVNIPFSYLLKAYNSPTSYAHVGGSLPPGITFNATNGLLSGTPTTAGTYTPSFTATNTNGTSSPVSVTITINLPPPPVVAANQTTAGYLQSGFRYQIVANSNPTSYALTSGSLPPGVNLNTTTGVLSGTLSAAGTFTPAFTATNPGGTSAPVAVSVTIHASLGLIVQESFNYTLGTNNPDPDGGLNTNNGLPATNIGGNPAGTSTGLMSTWGTSTDVVAGLSYSQGAKVLLTSGNAGRVTNATWGTSTPSIYRNMATDPFISDRIDRLVGTNFGVDGTSLFVSLLGAISSNTTSASADSFRLSFRYDGNQNFYLSNTTSGWSLNGTVAANAPLAVNTTTFFILRFDFAPGATDTISLWVNPPLGQALGTPNAQVTGRNFPGLGNFQTNAAVANAMIFDELRVGTSLAAVTPLLLPPAAPSALTASVVSTSQINLTWTDNSSSETGFKLERSTDGSTGWTQIATPPANATNVSDSGLATATTYYYRLRATNAAGDSAFSNVATATTQNGLQAFRAANRLDANGSQDLLFPGNDGVANLLKYAFNMLGEGAGQANALSKPNTAVLTPDGTAGLPLVGVGSGVDAGKLQLTFIRRKASSGPGISYTVEWSDALATWGVNTSTGESVTSIDDTLERVTVTDSASGSTRRFVRVRVSAF